MALYRSSLAHMDVTEQLIEQSRDAVLDSRELLDRSRPIGLIRAYYAPLMRTLL
jgi:hypothetical protein